MESNQKLTIFLSNGKTLRFYNVVDFEVSSGSINFKYFGNSTQQWTVAAFTLTSIAGWGLALSELGNEDFEDEKA